MLLLFLRIFLHKSILFFSDFTFRVLASFTLCNNRCCRVSDLWVRAEYWRRKEESALRVGHSINFTKWFVISIPLQVIYGFITFRPFEQFDFHNSLQNRSSSSHVEPDDRPRLFEGFHRFTVGNLWHIHLVHPQDTIIDPERTENCKGQKCWGGFLKEYYYDLTLWSGGAKKISNFKTITTFRKNISNEGN